MKNKLRATQLITWVTSSLLSIILAISTVFFLLNEDRLGSPESANSRFSLIEVPAHVTDNEFLDTLQSLAQSQESNIYKVTPGGRLDGHSSDYYLFTGNPETVQGELTTGYFPSFSRIYTAQLLDGATLSRDQFLGTYFVQGNGGSAHTIIEKLKKKYGVNGQATDNIPSYSYWAPSLLGSSWAAALTVLSLTLLLALSQLYIARLNIQALRQSMGKSLPLLRIKESLFLALPALIPAVVTTCALLIYSLAIARGYRFTSLVAIATQIGALLCLIWLSSLAFTGIAAHRISLGQLLKGKRPLLLLSALSTILLMISAYGSALSSWQTLQKLTISHNTALVYNLLKDQTSLVSPDFGYSLQTQQGSKDLETLDTVYRQLENENHAYLASANPLNSIAAAESPESLLVNIPYLQKFTDLDQSTLSDIWSALNKPGTTVVLIPSNLAEQSEYIKDQVFTWATFQQEINHQKNLDLSVEVYPAESTETLPLFDFQSGEYTYSKNPVLLVTSSVANLISINNLKNSYIAYDYKSLKRLVDSNNISGTVISYTSVSESSSLELANRRADLVMSGCGTLFSLLSLIIGSAILAGTYHLRNMQAIFIQKTVGARYSEKYGDLMSTVTLSVTVPLAVYIFFGAENILLSVLTGILIYSIIIATILFTLQRLERQLTRVSLENI